MRFLRRLLGDYSVFSVYLAKGFANDKSQYLYKSLPVNTKTAFLSRKFILLAILLHGQFIHDTQISLHPNMFFFFHCSTAHF